MWASATSSPPSMCYTRPFASRYGPLDLICT
jgi:hypothetical protein